MSEKSTVVLDGHLLDPLFLKRITSYNYLQTNLRSAALHPGRSRRALCGV